MKIKGLLDLITNAEYEDFANEYKKLLGYEKNTVFYGVHQDTDKLIEHLNEKFKFNLDPAYIIFMKDSNGCELDGTTLFSFKHEEQKKDILFVNFDKSTRDFYKVSNTAFIAGSYQSAAIVYDKASIIFDDESETGYAWGIYSHRFNRYLETGDNFLDILTFLIDDRIEFFEED